LTRNLNYTFKIGDNLCLHYFIRLRLQFNPGMRKTRKESDKIENLKPSLESSGGLQSLEYCNTRYNTGSMLQWWTLIWISQVGSNLKSL